MTTDKDKQTLAEIIEDFFFHDYKSGEAGLINAMELATKILERMDVKEKKTR